MANSLVGSRIRQRRRAQGIKQADLAREAGISASYLNLIEHNRRNAAGKVLSGIARALDLPLEELREGAEAALVADLRGAAQEFLDILPEPEAVEELIGQHPEWTRLIGAQMRHIRDQEAAISALTDRLNYDPRLQETLHEMLTTVTAIRSTASILDSDDELPKDVAQNFQGAINEESRRLSSAAQSLVSYFDKVEAKPKRAATPQEAFELFLAQNEHMFPALDEIETPAEAMSWIEAQVADDPLLDSPEARDRARARMTLYGQDARAMPLHKVHDVAARSGFSPMAIAQHFGQDLHAAFRRLVVLRRTGIEAPACGLVIVNAAGHPLYRRPLPAFSLPRFTAICALWPVFQALTRPNEPLEDVIVLPDGREYLARSIASPLNKTGFGERPELASAMMVTSLAEVHAFGMVGNLRTLSQRDVGTSCRLCPRSGLSLPV